MNTPGMNLERWQELHDYKSTSKNINCAPKICVFAVWASSEPLLCYIDSKKIEAKWLHQELAIHIFDFLVSYQVSNISPFFTQYISCGAIN